MKPGIYNLTNDEYHAHPAISRSGINMMNKSMFHFWDAYLNEDKKKKVETPAMLFGSVLHTLVLEPELFTAKYFVADKPNQTSNKGKEEWKEVKDKAGNLTIVSGSVFEKAEKMAARLILHKRANQIICNGLYEQSIFWIDPETGIECKCRPDILRKNMIGDLKTTADASYFAFQRSLNEYGYHIQCAMMREASRHVLPNEINDFIFICVENVEPYVPAIYPLAEDAIDLGERKFKEALVKYKKCLETNEWPGYEIQEITLSSFAFAS